MTRCLLLLAAMLPFAAFAQNDALLLYAPFDGSADAVIAGGNPGSVSSSDHSFVDGRSGEAILLQADCEFETTGNFVPEQGTFAAWVRPHWSPDDGGSRLLFCIYGQRDLPHSWAVNRWNLAFYGGQCVFTISTSQEGKTPNVSAPVTGWEAGQWHHVVITWDNINSGEPDAEMRMYFDGEQAAELSGKQIDVGPMHDLMAIGRDQDGSPDYLDGDIDDLFIYGRALSAEEIAAGFEWDAGSIATAAAPAPEAYTPKTPEGWWSPEWPHRTKVILPATDENREGAFIQCPLTIGADIAAMGIGGRVMPDSIRVVENGAVVPARLDGSLLEWQAPGTTPAGKTREFEVYFRAATYKILGPLQAALATDGCEPGPEPAPAPDYASLTYGRPWDFEDGTFSGIDQWGNKPEFLKNRKVEDGILSMDVEEDPWFIWGDMWGQVDAANQKVAIDVAKFPVLEMRVRQSVGSAEWTIYGRPGTGTQLINYDFPVTGSGWQRVRVDLAQDARWRGVLSAFRIDPTNQVKAHVEIDWVRLMAVSLVQHGPVETLGTPNAKPEFIALRMVGGPLEAGSRHEIHLELTGADREPVVGQPVRLSLEPGSGGQLEAAQTQSSLAVGPGIRRGITDSAGRFAVTYVADRTARPSADRITASVEFADCARATVTTNTRPGAPHHYSVSPVKVATLKEAELPLALTAQLVDQFGNAVAQKRGIRWTTDDPGLLSKASPELDDAGKATAQWRGIEQERWVYHVRVEDDQGLTGQSAAICLLPSQPRKDPVVLDESGYFTRGPGGPSWLPFGGFYANWVGVPADGEEGRRLVSFVDATEEELAHWLEYLASQGVTGMRFMLRAHTPQGMEPMDVIGRVNMPLFARVLRYMDMARKHDIRFMLTIHEDYTKPAYYNQSALETFCIPRYEGEDLDALPAHQRRFIRDRKLIGVISDKYTDPDVMACQDQYTRQLIALLKDNPQLFSWEFENEMVECPESWADHMAAVIRQADPVTPICASHGGGGIHTADPLWWTKRTDIDFYTYHIYPTTTTTSPEIDYGASIDMLACYGRMAGVCMLGESAGDEWGRYPKDRDADRRYVMRDIIWFSVVNGNPGCYFWNARGHEVEQFRLANAITSRIDWRTWRRQKPDVAIDVSHPWEDDKHYRTPQGRADYAMMGQYAQHYLSAGVDFDFAMGPAGYKAVADLKQFAPPAADAYIAPSEGWQVRTNAREGLAEGLAYVRNFAGVRQWQETEGSRRANLWLRDRAPSRCTLKLNVPHASLKLVATDLDTGDEKVLTVAGDGELDLGVSEHDWALHWKAE